MGKRGRAQASDLSSAITWPYGFLTLFGVHFLVSKIKAHTRSSPKSFPGFRSCERFVLQKPALPQALTAVRVLLAFLGAVPVVLLSALVTLALSRESEIYSFSVPTICEIPEEHSCFPWKALGLSVLCCVHNSAEPAWVCPLVRGCQVSFPLSSSVCLFYFKPEEVCKRGMDSLTRSLKTLSHAPSVLWATHTHTGTPGQWPSAPFVRSVADPVACLGRAGSLICSRFTLSHL